MGPMEFKQAVTARHSVRDFIDRAVSDEDLREVVGLAGQAASWCDAQPWKVYAVRGEALGRIRERWGRRLAAGEQGKMDFEGVHREDMTEAAAANMGDFFAAVGPFIEAGTMAPQVLYGAPVVLVLTVPKGASPYVMYDLGAFAEQLMLAAADRGIDSLVAAMFVAYPDVLRAELPIPDDEAIAIGIALSYGSDAETNSIVAPRMAVDDYLTVCE